MTLDKLTISILLHGIEMSDYTTDPEVVRIRNELCELYDKL